MQLSEALPVGKISEYIWRIRAFPVKSKYQCYLPVSYLSCSSSFLFDLFLFAIIPVKLKYYCYVSLLFVIFPVWCILIYDISCQAKILLQYFIFVIYHVWYLSVCKLSWQVKISSGVIVLMRLTHLNGHQDIQPWSPWRSWIYVCDEYYTEWKYTLDFPLTPILSSLIISTCTIPLCPLHHTWCWLLGILIPLKRAWYHLYQMRNEIRNGLIQRFSHQPFFRLIFSLLLGFSDGIVLLWLKKKLWRVKIL